MLSILNMVQFSAFKVAGRFELMNVNLQSQSANQIPTLFDKPVLESVAISISSLSLLNA